MNCLSIDEMKSKLASLPIPHTRKMWLMERMDSLYKYHSLKSRLRAGLLLNYATTNRTENVNSRLKLEITRRIDGKRCTQQLLKFIDSKTGQSVSHKLLIFSDEKRELCKAILDGNSEVVSTNHFRSSSHATPESRAKKLMEIGFHTFPVAFVFNVPQDLWKGATFATS